MNVENLRNNYHKIISHMETTGYSNDHTGRVRREIQWILAEAGNKGWDCYNDVCRYYEALPLSPGNLVKKRAIIGIIYEFDLHGKYPDGKRSGLVERGSYPKLVPEFRSLIDYHSMGERERGKKESSINTESKNVSAFLLASIDWECDLIRIRQQKTEEPLELPLTATVGNAIYDYITNERPPVDCPILFLTQVGPYRGMESASIWRVAARIMEEAGIRQSKGDRRGFHIFRHHLATTLLGSGVPQAVISGTLGHAAPESVEAYISADLAHLKGCALSIARFPVPEGVFADA